MTYTVTINGHSYSDRDTPLDANDRNLGGYGNRSWFFPLMTDVVTVAGQVQAWSAQAQAAAGAGGGTIFPTVSNTDAGEGLLLNSAGTSYLATPVEFGLANKIINGSLNINSRNVTTTTTNLAFMLDRMQHYLSNTGSSWSVQPGFNGFANCIRARRTAANASVLDLYVFNHTLPSEISKPLAGKQVTLSMFVRAGANYSPTSGTFKFSIIYGTGTDQNVISGFTNQTTLITGTDTITTIAKRVSVTATVPSNATQLGVIAFFTPVGTALADDYAEVTGIMLNEGPVALSYQQLPYALDQLLCKRFYQTFSAWVPATASAKISVPIFMHHTPTIAGGGAGFESTNATKDMLICSQITQSTQTLTLSAEL